MLPPEITLRVILVQVPSVIELRVFVTLAHQGTLLARAHETVDIEVGLIASRRRGLNISSRPLVIGTDLVDINTARRCAVRANDTVFAAICAQIALNHRS